MDNGDIIAQKSFSIEYEDSIKEVYAKATTASKGILLDILSDIKNVEFTPQNKDTPTTNSTRWRDRLE